MLFGAADAYDLVLIDCPPNVLECSHQALYASDGVVIPLIPDDFGVQGITPVLAAIGRVKRVNHRLCLVGYLLNRFRARLSLHRLYADELDDAYGVDCFTPRVPDTIAFATALLERKPVTHAAPKSPAALAMGVVVDDLLSRISERCGIGAHRPIREVV
jgi:chromosome partitioning protein